MKKSSSMRGCFFHCKKAAQKHGWYPSQSVWRASLSAKSQENPASTLLLSSGNAGSCCMWMVSVLLRWVIIFFTNLQNPFRFPGAGEREGKIGSLYTGILDSFLSKLHSGRNYRDIHDRWEIEFFHGKRPHFSLHTFILHKPLLFTTSSQKIFYSASPSFRPWPVSRQ